MVAELERFREKYPDYADIDDATLAGKLATKYPEAYGDLPSKVGSPMPMAASHASTAPALVSSHAPVQEKTFAQKASPYIRPLLEVGGAAGGAALAAPANIIAPGAASVVGAGLGFAGGKQAADLYDEWAGVKQPEGLIDRTAGAAKDVGYGMLYQMAPEAIGAVAKPVLRAGGKIVKGILGRTTGAGTEFANQAVESGVQRGATSPFQSVTPGDLAARGKTTGQEVVENAKAAVANVREARKARYLSDLQGISANSSPLGAPGNLDPVTLAKTLKDDFRIDLTQGPNGKYAMDFSQSPWMGENKRRAKLAIEEVLNNKDTTPLGLDSLKRRLDSLYSGASESRSLVSKLRNEVKDHIVSQVPEYADMTKGYSELTGMIDDFEHGLMLRKKTGLGERVTADMTLRRLTSALRDNFPLRKELLGELGQRGGRDLLAQTAGHAAQSWLPSGLQGSGPALVGEIALSVMNPKVLPVVAASSPRVVWELLAATGQMGALAKPLVDAAGKPIGRVGAMQFGEAQRRIAKAFQDKAREEMKKDQPRVMDRIRTNTGVSQ
jgi:hypothetical protein